MRYKPVSFRSLLNQESAVESYKAAALQFILTELDIARVFYELALTTGYEVRAFANEKNAHTAVRAALRVTKRVRTRLSQAEHRAIAERVAGLKYLFERLHSKRSRETRATNETPRTSALSNPIW